MAGCQLLHNQVNNLMEWQSEKYWRVAPERHHLDQYEGHILYCPKGDPHRSNRPSVQTLWRYTDCEIPLHFSEWKCLFRCPHLSILYLNHSDLASCPLTRDVIHAIYKYWPLLCRYHSLKREKVCVLCPLENTSEKKIHIHSIAPRN